MDTDPDLVHMETQDLGGGKSGPGEGGGMCLHQVCALLGSSAGWPYTADLEML